MSISIEELALQVAEPTAAMGRGARQACTCGSGIYNSPIVNAISDAGQRLVDGCILIFQDHDQPNVPGQLGALGLALGTVLCCVTLCSLWCMKPSVSRCPTLDGADLLRMAQLLAQGLSNLVSSAESRPRLKSVCCNSRHAHEIQFPASCCKGLYLQSSGGGGSWLRSGLGRLQRCGDLGIGLRILAGGARQRQHDSRSLLHIMEPEGVSLVRPIKARQQQPSGMLNALVGEVSYHALSNPRKCHSCQAIQPRQISLQLCLTTW